MLSQMTDRGLRGGGGAGAAAELARLRALLDVLRAMNAELEERPLLRRSGETVARHLAAAAAELRMAAAAPIAFRSGDRTGLEPLEWMHERALETAELVRDRVVVNDEELQAACMPLVAYERALGSLLVVRAAPFCDGEIELLETVGHELGTAVEHARILRRATMDAERLERQAAESEVVLVDRNEQLARTRWLAALGQIAAGVAHDLNNALNPIVAFADLIDQHADQPELVRQYAERILLAARDGAKTVQRIQLVTRKRRGVMPTRSEVVPLARVVKEAVELARSTWVERRDAHVDVEQHVSADLLAWANAAELREALLNLIGNALDAMPDGGVIRFVGAREGEEAVLAVQDTGSGMSQEVRRRALEPFFTTKGMRGTGLGLSEVYGILRRHGGTIEIESWPGLGSTIQLRLPAAEKAAAEKAPRPRRRRPAGPRRLLVVDDNLLSAEATAVALRVAGHDVTVAASAESALEVFEPGAYDVVLTDLGLPGMSGWDLIDQLRARDPDARFGVITGWAVERGDDELRRRKIDLVFLKPVDPEELLTAL